MAELTEERRERFLRAAVGCFARHGYRRTSMDVIAQAADVSRPALYQYFRNKEEIFRAAVGWGLEKVAERAEAEAGTPGDAVERLAVILDLVLEMYTASGETGRPGGMFYAELVNETYARANDVWTAFEARLLTALRSVLERPGSRLDRGTAGVPPDDVAQLLLLGAKGIALHTASPGQGTLRVRQLVTLTVRGLAAHEDTLLST
jgi:TetR/AcrR family transcriptional regulator